MASTVQTEGELPPLVDEVSTCLQRRGSASCVIDDEYILIFGGENNEQCFRDCWKFHVSERRFEFVGEAPETFSPRAFHTATLVGRAVWLIGGGNIFAKKRQVVDDVWYFDVAKETWHPVDLVNGTNALSRTGHGACIKPDEDSVIMIFGGYSITPGPRRRGTWRNDLLEFHVNTRTCKDVNATNPPSPRAHMTFHRVGNFCISLFGRSSAKTLISKQRCLAVYDPSQNTWLSETSGRGNVPSARYSHVSSVHGQHIIVFGGVLDKADPSRRGALSILHFDQKNALVWLQGSPKRQDSIQHRVGHVQNIVNDTLYIMGGFHHGGYHTDVNMVNIFIREKCFDCIVCESGMSISESVISETEDPISCSKDTKRRRETQDALHRNLNAIPFMRPDKAPRGSAAFLQKELDISDMKWKEAKEESLNWKQLAAEERDKSDKAVEKFLQVEHKYLTLSSSLSLVAEFFQLGDLDTCYDTIGGYITQQIADHERIQKESRGKLLALRGELQQYQEKQKHLENALAQSRQNAENLESTYKGLLEKSANDMKLLMSRYNQDTSKGKTEMSNLRNQIDVLNTDLDMRASYCADLEKSCIELRSKCTDLENALHDFKSQLVTKDEENEKLRDKLSAIRHAIGDMTDL